MHELTINLHTHTRYSDGIGLHRDIAHAALQTGLDVVIVTDHNVMPQGHDGYYREGKKRVLLLVGEEIHDQARKPQKNHLLVIGAGRDLATLGADPQTLINEVSSTKGLTFIAHPVDPAQPAFNEPDISWVDWDVDGYTGIELWNGFSEFKSVFKSKLHGLFYGLFPEFTSRGPFANVLAKWDDLLSKGRHVVAVGGSDAHALHANLGFLRRIIPEASSGIIFPYEFHFTAINTHLFVPQPLSGDLVTDQRMIMEALSSGRAFVGYDLPLSTRGFLFTAQSRDGSAIMGEEISARGGVTLQARLPSLAEIRLIKDGHLLRTWKRQEACTHITTEPGIYRIEAYRHYLGCRRGWIFSNPIYVK